MLFLALLVAGTALAATAATTTGSGVANLRWEIEGISKITDAEKELIQRALQETRGNKSTAAEKLGISRRTLYRKLEEYKLT